MDSLAGSSIASYSPVEAPLGAAPAEAAGLGEHVGLDGGVAARVEHATQRNAGNSGHQLDSLRTVKGAPRVVLLGGDEDRLPFDPCRSARAPRRTPAALARRGFVPSRIDCIAVLTWITGYGETTSTRSRWLTIIRRQQCRSTPSSSSTLPGSSSPSRALFELLPVFTHDVAARETPDGNHHD